MKSDYMRKKFIFKTICFIIMICLLIVIEKKIKHSNFITTLHRTDNKEQGDVLHYDAAAKQDASQFSVSLSGFYFDNPTETRQIGRPVSITDSNSNMFYSVNYPEIGIAHIDEVLRNDVQEELSKFCSGASGYIADNDSMRIGLTVDYCAYLTGDSILSVVYNIIYDSPEYTNPLQTVRTHTFLLCTGKEIGISTLLSGDYLQYLSDSVTGYLASDPELSLTMNDSAYSEKYEPDEINFKNFAFSKSGLTLYFDPYTIAPGEFGIISVPINAQDIMPFIIYDPFKESNIPYTPPAETAPPVIQSEIDPSKPMVALTFDDGPRGESTNRILDVLENYNCHATFFVVGTNLSKYPDTVKRAAAMNCDIGNHSFGHAKLSTLNKKGIKAQFSKTNDILKKYINKKAKFVRTPYGQTGNILKHVNFPVILWNVDTLDWKTLNAKKVIKAATKDIEDGDIILMHDIYNSTAEAVETIVPKLLSQGFQIVSISELFKYRDVTPKKHKVYFNLKP
ncbi:MAG: polysaccharide deacetylase family protein [Lachnospiraceae bacterium]|nr:polysaccharide deacetylase family protein [Lachnospiraceae bacterium]